jgi:hypothetical protein
MLDAGRSMLTLPLTAHLPPLSSKFQGLTAQSATGLALGASGPSGPSTEHRPAERAGRGAREQGCRRGWPGQPCPAGWLLGELTRGLATALDLLYAVGWLPLRAVQR